MTLDGFAVETEDAVDDLVLLVSGGGRIYLQIKRRVTASTASTADLSKAVDQFVRQYLGVAQPAGRRHFDARRDRLVLACSGATGRPIANALPAVLNRIRDMEPASLDQFRLRNDSERSAWPALLSVLRSAWATHAGEAPSDAAAVGLLKVLYIDQLLVEDGERDESVALTWLGETILADRTQRSLAWAVLLEKSLRAAGEQSGATRDRLRSVLSVAGLQLAVSPERRADVERLKARTEIALAHLAPHAGLRVGGRDKQIQRPLASALRDRVLTGSTLVVGPPGAGKTGALHALASELLESGHDVVVLAADTFSIADLDELQNKLQLTVGVSEVLADWPGRQPGILVIDALDAARGADGSTAFTDLVEQIASCTGRWHVVGSVRTFDLRHNPTLRDAMPVQSGGTGSYELQEFAEVQHFAVGDLSPEELGQLEDVAPLVHQAIEAAQPRLRELVRNPFNLSLLARLVEQDVAPEELTPIRTQLELLHLYWRYWVESPAAGHDEREGVIGTVCEEALAQMRLQVARQSVTAGSDGDALQSLLAAGVLVEIAGGGLLEPERIAFSHHILFDYAFARSSLQSDPAALAQQLAATPDAVLLARPALVMRLSALWATGEPRTEFWAAALALASQSLSDPVRLVAPAVIVELCEQSEDVQPLLVLAGGDAPNPDAVALLAEVVNALIARGSDTRPLAGLNVDLWADTARRIGEVVTDALIEPLRVLVWALWREAAETATSEADDER